MQTAEIESGLTVQQMAKRTGLSEHTLRYYERAGLIPSVPRDTENGHRRYDVAALRTIEFLKRLRTTGMPIREMQRYIALYQEGDTTVLERRALLMAHRETVRRRIEDLQSCLEGIDLKISSYYCLEMDNCDDESYCVQRDIK